MGAGQREVPMTKPKNAMEIFQHLDRSNCRECGDKTCLAFAGAVYTGRKSLHECPKIDAAILQHYDGGPGKRPAEESQDDYMEQLQRSIRCSKLADLATKIGADYSNDRLTLKVMGKNFSVDIMGNLHAEIHVNPWIAVPFLNYVLYGKGLSPNGSWVSFRELRRGHERYPLFKKRSELPIKKLADTYPDFFNDLVHLFSGKAVARQFQSDISVVLHPLPNIPIMICYWKPDEGLASSLNLYFDPTADDNLDIGSLFSLGAGLAQMFEKLSHRHGAD